MFLQLTLLACLLVGSLGADAGLKTAASSTNTRAYFVNNYPRPPWAANQASATQFQPAAHHPRQPFAVAPAAPVAHSEPHPSALTRNLPTTNFKCADMPHSFGLYADESANCQVYHYCTKEYQYSFACGEGTAFNQQLMTCDYPQNFVCKDSKLYHSATANIGVETGLAAPVVPKTSFTCQGKPFVPGFYADVENQCASYHVCVGEEQFDFNCSEGTVFSQELLTCTYAAEVDCAKSADFYYKNDDIGVSQEEFRHRPPICRRHPHLHFCRHHTTATDTDAPVDQSYNIGSIGRIAAAAAKQLKEFCKRNPKNPACKNLPK